MMAEKREIKNKQKSHKSLKREKLHARKLPLLQYMFKESFYEVQLIIVKL